MCRICDDLGIPGFCTEYSDLFCYVYSNYECNEILPTLITLYKYLKDVMTVDVFPIAVNGKKECSRGHKIKPATLEFFGKNFKSRDGLTSSCKECKSKYDRNRHLEKTYDLLPEVVRRMLRDQNYECPSCEDHINIDTKKVHHNHENGKVFDLLCHNCNTIIGFAHNNYRVLLKCAIYQALQEGVDLERLKDLLRV